MLCEVPLNKEQQAFAADHHGLVYKFLNENRLPEDEFYDVMSSGRLPLNHSAASAPRKGMSPFLLEEMKKQLEVPLWIP